jgi:hypothetical protein
MRKRISLLLVATVAAISIAGVAAASGSSSDLTGPETLHLGAITAAEYIESGGHHSSQEQTFRDGDQRTYRYRLTDPSTGARIGFGQMFCASTVGSLMLCSAAYVLPGQGQIELQGSWSLNKKPNILAVVGGTGRFRNAHGDAQIVGLPFDGFLDVTVRLIALATR